MKLHVIHFETNADLPEAVRTKVPDEVGQTILRHALNQAVGGAQTPLASRAP